MDVQHFERLGLGQQHKQLPGAARQADLARFTSKCRAREFLTSCAVKDEYLPWGPHSNVQPTRRFIDVQAAWLTRDTDWPSQHGLAILEAPHEAGRIGDIEDLRPV